jgi:hypothetical protein
MVVAVKNRLQNNIVIGGTGLSASVEAAIWQRDLERNEQQLSDSTDKVTSMWAKKGFSLPDGMLAHSLSEIQREYMNKMLDRTREIAIKQADLEQSNLFKSMELAISLTFKLIDGLTKYEELLLRAQEDTAKYANEYIDLQIKAHNGTVEVFKAVVQYQEALVRSELTKAEIYKAQIQGALAVATANEATAKVYTAQIEAEVARYKGVIDGNVSLAQMFTAQVNAVVAQAGIQESLIKVYAEQVRATVAQAEVYKAQVEAVTAGVGAQKAVVEANVAQVQAWAEGVRAKTAAYSGSLESFRAQNTFNIASAELGSKNAEIIIANQIEAAKVAIASADITMKAITKAGDARVEAAKGAASASASLGAGAMAAMSAHANLSYSETMPLKEA